MHLKSIFRFGVALRALTLTLTTLLEAIHVLWFIFIVMLSLAHVKALKDFANISFSHLKHWLFH